MDKNGAPKAKSKTFETLLEEVEDVEVVEVHLEDLDVEEIWTTGGRSRRAFINHLAKQLSDPSSTDRLRWCVICSLPGIMEQGNAVDQISWVHGRCAYACNTCDDCDRLVSQSTLTDTDRRVCDTCLSSHWFFCEDCDYWTRNYNAGEHNHDSNCNCDVFATTFSVKNGKGLLANDTSTTITLPGGFITDEGLAQISTYLRFGSYSDFPDGVDPEIEKMASLSFALHELGQNWQTREGNYTKRLSRLAYKSQKMKIPPTVLSRVGDIARDHSKPIDLTVEVTRELNLGPGDFCHDDSCWWQSYSASRCALKSNGGFALRTFGPHYVSGRAWVLPLMYTQDARPQFQPTFETVEPDAFVVFNGYCDLEGYAPARLLAHMTGMTYRKIAFGCDPMYVNAGGYLVTTEAIAHLYTDQAISLVVTRHANLYENERETLNV